MNTAPRTLEALFDQVRALDEQQQAWIAERLEEQLAEAKGESNHEDALKDLDYRAYVENALAEAEARSGSPDGFRPMLGEAFDALEAAYKGQV